jgi:HSP20 family protein
MNYLREPMRPPAWHPPTDLYETEGAIIARVEIAGMSDDDFSIELNGRLLTIRGIRQDIPERRAYHQMEIRFGEFSIDLELPASVDTDQVEAVYSNGILRVLLPKALPHQIPILD